MSTTTVRVRDLAERVVWTAISAGLGVLTISGVIDVSALEAAFAAAASALVNALLVIARWRLSVLPDPGAGLPGSPQPTPPL